MKRTLAGPRPTVECPVCGRHVDARTDGSPRMHWHLPSDPTQPWRTPWCEGGNPLQDGTLYTPKENSTP